MRSFFIDKPFLFLRLSRQHLDCKEYILYPYQCTLYGSSRLGTYNINRDLIYSQTPNADPTIIDATRTHKNYELSNHLGNVLTTVSDRKLNILNAGVYEHSDPEYVSTSDYYPFGLQMSERTISSNSYRYGFNGKEKDEDGEWGDITTYDYGFRIYNPGIGKFLSVDPLTQSYPMLTPYQFASNRPIDGLDLDGLEFLDSKDAFFTFAAGDIYLSLKRERHLLGKQSTSIVTNSYGDQFFGTKVATFIHPLPPVTNQEAWYQSDNVMDALNERTRASKTAYDNSPRRKGDPSKTKLAGKNGWKSRRYEQNQSSAAGMGKAGLIFIVADLAYQTYKAKSLNDDYNEHEKQVTYVKETVFAINSALIAGKIKPKFQNRYDLSSIANFIYKGKEIKNKELMEIAKNLTKKITYKGKGIYKYPVKYYETVSGMDNYPTKTVPFIDKSEDLKKDKKHE